MQSQQSNLVKRKPQSEIGHETSRTLQKLDSIQQESQHSINQLNHQSNLSPKIIVYLIVAVLVVLVVKFVISQSTQVVLAVRKQKQYRLSKHQLEHRSLPLDKSYSNFVNTRQIPSWEEDQYQQQLMSLKSHPPFEQHIHVFQKSPIPTIGVPKADSYSNYKRVFLPRLRDYEIYLNNLIKPYNDTDCEHAIFGTEPDSSYILCKNFIPHSTAIINSKLQGSDSFGCNITRQFNLTNYIFDCTRQYKENMCEGNDKMKYVNRCFGEKIELIEMHHFTTIERQLQTLNLKGQPVIMKLDIDGAIWSALRFTREQILQNVDQLVIEVHLPEDYEKQHVYWGNIDIINTLQKHFISVNLHLNNNQELEWFKFATEKRFYTSRGLQVTLVNRKLIKINKQTKNYPEKIPNLSNNPHKNNMIMKQY